MGRYTAQLLDETWWSSFVVCSKGEQERTGHGKRTGRTSHIRTWHSEVVRETHLRGRSPEHTHVASADSIFSVTLSSTRAVVRIPSVIVHVLWYWRVFRWSHTVCAPSLRCSRRQSMSMFARSCAFDSLMIKSYWIISSSRSTWGRSTSGIDFPNS